MTAAERQATRRRDAIAKGLCLQCCREPVSVGRKRCAECLTANQARNRGQKRPRRSHIEWTPFCLECIAAGGFHRSDCATRKVAA